MKDSINKLIHWINYWLVPENATMEQRNRRIGEVGFSIGMITCFIVGIFILAIGVS